jgi:hypothetical protein
MVKRPRRHSKHRKADGKERWSTKRREEKTSNKKDTMVFGDNVRARRAARALPRTPPTKEEEEEEKKENKKDKQRKLHTHHTTAIPQPTTQYDKTRQDTHHPHTPSH